MSNELGALAERFGNLRTVLLPDIAQEDRGTALDQPTSNRRARPACCPGHDRNPSGKIAHARLLQRDSLLSYMIDGERLGWLARPLDGRPVAEERALHRSPEPGLRHDTHGAREVATHTNTARPATPR